MKSTVVALAMALSCVACSDDQGSVDAGAVIDDVCAVAPGDDVSFDYRSTECDRLSSYRFFVGDDLAALTPNDRVVEYTLNTPLFSDYTAKYRFLWVPEGTTIDYSPEETFDIPVGAAIIKNFAYLDDIRDPDGPRQLLETRIMYRTDTVWEVTTYVWNDEQTEAYRDISGERVHASWVHYDGQTRDLEYSVPNKNQCKNCHEERNDTTSPIGPKARHLNRDVSYPGGARNQLAYMAEIGILSGLPADIAEVPRAPVWDDPSTGTLEERARIWMDINCSHCHNPTGAARTSGLDLLYSQDNPYDYGVCKSPVAAGGGSGGFLYNIVPGQPEQSILMYRLDSTELDVRMPEVGRQLVHQEGVELVRSWIASMEGDCATVE